MCDAEYEKMQSTGYVQEGAGEGLTSRTRRIQTVTGGKPHRERATLNSTSREAVYAQEANLAGRR
jgi:hypothetical protein